MANFKPITKEWLHGEYIDKRRSGDDIARELGVDPKTIWKWLRDCRIPTRPRGTDYGQCIKPGEKLFLGRKHSEKTKNAVREARFKDGRKPYLVNGVHWLKAYNAKPASWRGGITPERQAFYASLEWKECVKSVWARDDAKCRRCGLDHRTIEKRGNPRFTIHHVDSFMVKDRRAVVENLILLCWPCHRWVHSKKNKSGDFLGEGHKSVTR